MSKIVQIITPNDLTYQPLNPARGDAAPQAGVLWGDIREDVPSGTLLRFADGFSSPPHIHNITYRGVVISGGLHNDDPNAEKMWMGPGSFWTQPAGEDHITAAKPGAPALSFLEILEGPYLVQPSSEAFQNDEQPLNLDYSNIVWMSADDAEWITLNDASDANDSAKMTFLWGATEIGEPGASMVKLPAGYTGSLSSTGDVLRVVVIGGDLKHTTATQDDESDLPQGSYFSSEAGTQNLIGCESGSECLLYVRTDGRFDLASRE